MNYKKMDKLTVGKLKKILNEFPDDLHVVIYPKYSDLNLNEFWDEIDINTHNVSGAVDETGKLNRVRILF